METTSFYLQSKRAKNLIFALFILSTNYINAQWGQVNTGISDLTQGATLLGTSSTHIFSKANSKMFRSSDNGDNWTEIQPPVALNTTECGYYFNSKYFAGMNASTDCIYYTSDNGDNWNSVTGAPVTTVVRGFISHSSVIFAYTSNKGIYKSTDGGSNWDTCNVGLSNLNVISMLVINNKIYAATIGGGVFISTDDGDNWTQSNTGISGGDLNISLIWQMNSNIYIYSQGGNAYTSSDEGANWSSWTKPAQFGGSFGGPTEIVRKGGNLYLRSRILVISIPAQKDSVYFSNNEGASWTNITGNLPSNLNGSGIVEFGSYVFTAFNLSSPNLGIYRSGTTVSPSPTTGITEIGQENSIVYPNPFENILHVKNSNIVLNISIYSTNGEKLIELQKPMDMISLDSLSSGMYIIELTTNDGLSEKSLLVKK